MEATEYIDLFETKGPEYLVVIFFLISFVFFLKYLTTPAPKHIRKIVFSNLNLQSNNWFKFVPSFYFSKNHLYFAKAEGDTAYVGLDHFAKKLLGDPDKIYFPKKYQKLTKGEKILSFKYDNEEIDIKIPADIKILQVNKDFKNNPAFSNKADYTNDWLLKISIPDIENKFKQFLTGQSIKNWLDENINKLNSLMSQKESFVLQDGGEIINGFAKEISRDKWKETVNSFLDNID